METDPGNYLFAWTEAFERIEHGLHSLFYTGGASKSYLTKDGCRKILETIFGRRRSTGWLQSPLLKLLAAAAQVPAKKKMF